MKYNNIPTLSFQGSSLPDLFGVARFILLFALLSISLQGVVAQTRPPQQQPDKQEPNKQAPKGFDAGIEGGTPTVKADPNQTIQGALKDQKAKRQTKTKDPNKASWLGMRMQDLSARFNRYFNAKLRYDEGIARLKQDHKDNYEAILPVYVYNSGSGTTISSNLDDAIKKASLAIQLKPNSKWIDDCYQLIGQSYYLKGDNEAAVTSFQYVTKNFNRLNRRYPNKQQREIDKKLKEQERVDKENERELALKERKEQADQKKKETEQKKKDLAKERADKKKELDKAREDKQKEVAQAQKERKKEIEDKKAEQAKTQKERLKEAEQKKKEREKQQKQLKREKEKAIAAKKKGKPVPLPSSKTSDKEEKKPDASSEEKAEAVKPDKTETKVEQEAKPADEVKTPPVTKEEKSKKKEKEAKQKPDKQAKTDVDTTSVTTVDESSNGDDIGKGIDASEKAKGGANGGFLQHKPSRYDAMIWLAKAYIEKKQFSDAEQVLKIAKDDRSFPKKKLDDLAILEAHYYLTRQDWPQAKIALQNAIKVSKSKREKSRLFYILAQINSQDKNYADALVAFNKVLKSRPTFDMEFNTKLNIAQTKLRSGAFTQEQAVAYLERMTKENKYSDVTDQIFFAMAEIAIEKGDMAKATAYLGESTKNSTANKDQKAQSFLKLADLNYDLERYVIASTYYDSTLTLLPKTFPSYSDISNRRSVLTELVEFINTIALQDSLQNIAKMPEGNRQAYLQDAITRMEEEAAKKREAEALKEAAALEAANTPTATEAGAWYFYNPITRSNGQTEFNRRWGTRPLADNWRLSNKTSGIIAGNPNNDTSDAKNANDLMNLASEGKLTVADLLKTLPLTPEALAQSDTLIANALFGLGMAYRNRLSNLEKAMVTFDDLLRRYPTGQYSAQVHYTQYLMAKEKNNTQKANLHKNQLLQKYPETTFAKLIEDPKHLQALNEKGRQLEQYYEQTYAYYKQNNFDEVKRRSQEVNTLFTINSFQPKFDLLNALIVGHSQDKAAYITALREVILKHPTDEVKTKAEEILSYLMGNATSTPSSSGTAKPATTANYTYQAAARQYLAVSFSGYSQQISGLTNKLSDFNNSNFSVDKLKVNQMLLDPQTQVVLVKEFNDAEKAMNYFRTLQQNESTVFQGLDVAYKFFIISKPNFTEYFKQKDTDAYYDFFIQNYK